MRALACGLSSPTRRGRLAGRAEPSKQLAARTCWRARRSHLRALGRAALASNRHGSAPEISLRAQLAGEPLGRSCARATSERHARLLRARRAKRARQLTARSHTESERDSATGARQSCREGGKKCSYHCELATRARAERASSCVGKGKCELSASRAKSAAEWESARKGEQFAAGPKWRRPHLEAAAAAVAAVAALAEVALE